MSESSWEISGQYMESCSCNFLCPCLPSNLSAPPDDGVCHVAMAFHVERGHKDGVDLAGRDLVVLAKAPGPMIEGNWTVGVIVDDRASDAARLALTEIISGQAGGPMATLSELVGTFAGVEARPIHFERNGMKASVLVPDMIDQAIEGAASMADPDQPIYLDNGCHPANARLALAKATRSHFHAFGIDWDDTSGFRNGHFAPFDWRQ
jgi:hypothetical protein